ncbi:hypothetical protein K435DRAFT_674332 [Dendrothele bispora CBS 962.96]|uniref:Mitochondrial import inner membrane translocase subunit TIM50 n=1 Tax=Dendrothele bispora (strain CBS 962.96) TaxID=1314807 RepID=A0A4S8LPG5_DENBC|nr:hypothetical protein K435DRAFT_674332 [Dendrothele bispora CBS 962.96]
MASSSSWGTRQYSSSVYQPPPPGTTSLSHYPPPNRNNKLNSESLDEPLPEPIPSSPSPSYLSMSSQPSTRLSNPGDARKLIILDLNGTLLYRAPPKSRDLYPRKRGRDPRYIVTRPLRTVYARPYIPSFRKYLFHPETRKWLDVMVWSSAQPHSVEDMVGRVFGKNSGLIAVWARDTLGLNKAAYSSHLHSHSDSGHHRRPYLHSAQTTLLLDDSPLKARLQPWNHFCVPEYSREVWLRDGRVVAPPPPSSSLNEPTPSGFGSAPVESAPSLEAETDGGPKREVNAGRNVDDNGERTPRKYDETILAVIGILDAIKWQSNVAGWMKAKGVFRHNAPVHSLHDLNHLDPNRWFQYRDVRSHWVRRGKKALRELGIEIEAGVTGVLL